MQTLLVASKTDSNKLAGAITEIIKNESKVTLSSMGAGAVNQAVKAIAVAQRFLEPYNLNIVASPTFRVISIESEERTIIDILVETK